MNACKADQFFEFTSNKLLCRHIFGLRGDVKDNVHYVDEAALVYPAGHNIVIHNLESKQQQFMPLPAESEGLLGLALTPNRRFLAVTERAEKSTVTIYDLQTLKRRKVLASVDIGGKVSNFDAGGAAPLSVLRCKECTGVDFWSKIDR